MKRIKLHSATLAVFLGYGIASARAADEAGPKLELAFQNTLVSTYPDGRQAKLWLNPDGSYAAENRKHRPLRGSWQIKGDRVCFKQLDPPTLLPVTFCTPLHAIDVGASWQATAPTGEPVTITLIEGRP